MAVVFTQPIASHGGLNWDTNLEAALTELKTKANYADQGIPGADLNQIFLGGTYYGSGLTNAPGGSANGFLVLHMVRPDGAAQAQLAINVNADGLVYVRRYAGSWQPWQFIGSSGWVTSATGITAMTGWSLTSARYRQIGSTIHLGIVVSRTGAAITANANGIISASDVASFPASLTPGQTNGAIIASGTSSTVQVAGMVTSNAVLRLANATPSVGIATGAVLDLAGTYGL